MRPNCGSKRSSNPQRLHGRYVFVGRYEKRSRYLKSNPHVFRLSPSCRRDADCEAKCPACTATGRLLIPAHPPTNENISREPVKLVVAQRRRAEPPPIIRWGRRALGSWRSKPILIVVIELALEVLRRLRVRLVLVIVHVHLAALFVDHSIFADFPGPFPKRRQMLLG